MKIELRFQYEQCRNRISIKSIRACKTCEEEDRRVQRWQPFLSIDVTSCSVFTLPEQSAVAASFSLLCTRINFHVQNLKRVILFPGEGIFFSRETIRFLDIIAKESKLLSGSIQARQRFQSKKFRVEGSNNDMQQWRGKRCYCCLN